MVDVLDYYFSDESLITEKVINKTLGSLRQSQSIEKKKEADEEIRRLIQKHKEKKMGK